MARPPVTEAPPATVRPLLIAVSPVERVNLIGVNEAVLLSWIASRLKSEPVSEPPSAVVSTCQRQRPEPLVVKLSRPNEPAGRSMLTLVVAALVNVVVV